jgi:N-acyl homoserine lactone hydrolase
VLYQERWDRKRFEGVAEFSFEPWHYAIASIVVKHPSAGLVVVDPAFGRNVVDEMHRLPLPFKLLLGDGSKQRPLVDVMAQAGIDPRDVRYALATHVHWDHIGALADLPNAKVLLPRADLEWARTLTGYFTGGVMPHHLKQAKSRISEYDFTGPPVEGFPASFDFFGDGSVVAVPMPGHTPGHVALLVRVAGGRTVLLAGDASWTLRGVEVPEHKLVPIDLDREQVGEALGVLNRFFHLRPDVTVVPAHDAAALEQLPTCGAPAARD